jgi:hypothetical protein
VIYLLKYWKQLAGVAAILLVVWWIRGTGYDAAKAECKLETDTMVSELEAARAEAIKAAQEETLLLETIAMNEAALAAKTRAETVFVTNTVIKWKVKYAQNPNAGKCDMPPEFVRVHTAAVTNRVSEATPGGPQPDGPATGVTDIEVLDVDTANYATCHGWADQLRHFQSREIALDEAALTR